MDVATQADYIRGAVTSEAPLRAPAKRNMIKTAPLMSEFRNEGSRFTCQR